MSDSDSSCYALAPARAPGRPWWRAGRKAPCAHLLVLSLQAGSLPKEFGCLVRGIPTSTTTTNSKQQTAAAPAPSAAAAQRPVVASKGVFCLLAAA